MRPAQTEAQGTTCQFHSKNAQRQNSTTIVNTRTLLPLGLFLVSLTVAAADLRRTPLPIDLDGDGVAEIELSTVSQGFSIEYPNLFEHLLKTRGTTEVWVDKGTGMPAVYPQPGAWTPESDGTREWRADPAGYALQRYVLNGGDPRFGGGSVARNGTLGISQQPGSEVPPPEKVFLVVRYQTAAGLRLGWLHMPTFLPSWQPWSPGPFGSIPPFGPVDLKPLDAGSEPQPGATLQTLGSASVWPKGGMKVERRVDPTSGSAFLEVRWPKVQGWEKLEMAPTFNATQWTPVGSLDLGMARINLDNGDPRTEDRSPKFFRLR